jgi:hypothetical protein
MIFEFSPYKLDIDVEKTRDFYKTASLVSADCSCDGCRNYEKAIDFLPQKVISFFAQFGVEMKKVCEIYVNYARADDVVEYGGFYHVCGKVIAGDSAWIPTSPNTKHLEESKLFPITEDFKVAFHEDYNLLKDAFPLPVIQVELLANIPWVLEERNGYWQG